MVLIWLSTTNDRKKIRRSSLNQKSTKTPTNLRNDKINIEEIFFPVSSGSDGQISNRISVFGLGMSSYTIVVTRKWSNDYWTRTRTIGTLVVPIVYRRPVTHALLMPSNGIWTRLESAGWVSSWTLGPHNPIGCCSSTSLLKTLWWLSRNDESGAA